MVKILMLLMGTFLVLYYEDLDVIVMILMNVMFKIMGVTMKVGLDIK